MLLFFGLAQAQHQNNMVVDVDLATHILTVKQTITYYNQSSDTLNFVQLNDWNNAYSGKDTPLAKHFTDQFIKSFHLAKDYDRGITLIQSVTDQNGLTLNWDRPDKHPDIVAIHLKNPIYPGRKFTISLNYQVKVPNDRFTKFGFSDKTGALNLRDWYLTPSRYSTTGFVTYSNENVDDIANAASDYNLTLKVPNGISVTTDLQTTDKTLTSTDNYTLQGKSRMGFNVVIEPKPSFEVFKFPAAEVSCNLKENRVSDMQRAALVNQITGFISDNLGPYPYGKILVTQADYDRNPVYGLNQLPAFISPFPDTFLYEVRFLKTYLNAYLKNTLKLDPRKDNWIYDGIQMQLMIKYVDQYHAEKKMTGNLGNWAIFKGHHLFDVGYNEQYTYLYLLMARRNQDQPIGDPKNSLVKFNEQIAGKYRAGLSFNYLNDYLGNDIVHQSFMDFYKYNLTQNQTNRYDLEAIIDNKTDKDINWFFDSVVATRDLIDYKFGHVRTGKDSLRVTIKNVTGTDVPISLYTIKKGEVTSKRWFTDITTDSTFTIPRANADRLVLNYNEEIPEYNRRNNFKRLNKFFPNNKPLKFTFFQDLENPGYNQVFYVPSFAFNLYDGFSPGLRFHNKSMLEKPFIFDVSPTYSVKTQEMIGSFSLMYNHYVRDGELYNIRYNLGGSTYHYAPDARYTKFTPSVQFRIRDEDIRQNKKEFITLRQVMVNRERSDYIITDKQNENYSVFNARYSKSQSEITKHYNFYTDAQIANAFGKLSGEFQFRRLFNNNRQVNLRVFAGLFMYRSTTSDYFSFGLDRPTDYLFDYNYYGRSEDKGLFSQQFIMADGGFKSKFANRFANQWMITVNGSFNIWNWVELYGDAGMFKSKYNDTRFVYDSGVRLNLVTDYFELYFPVYSSNGFEPGQDNYSQKIRFVVTLSPGTLINLFTRKWF